MGSRNGFASAASQGGDAGSSDEPLASRWLSDVRSRIRKIQDSSPDKADRAGAISRDIDSRWLDLLAGPEGFITDPEWRALDGREVIWGDIVSATTDGNLWPDDCERD